NIHDSVEFLDVFIENIQGQLKTSVFRKPAAEPYILPYTSDHPRHIHSNTIQTALLRGVRLCSDVETFDQERLNIEIALLLNGYPPKFITHHFKQFFKNYNASPIYQDLHVETYQQLHLQLLNESLTTDQVPQQQGNETSNGYIKTKPKKQIELIIHYRYESGPLKKFNNSNQFNIQTQHSQIIITYSQSSEQQFQHSRKCNPHTQKNVKKRLQR
ncbi:unnamed protein product, partial [Rotaria sp. Silwood2]